MSELLLFVIASYGLWLCTSQLLTVSAVGGGFCSGIAIAVALNAPPHISLAWLVRTVVYGLAAAAACYLIEAQVRKLEER